MKRVPHTKPVEPYEEKTLPHHMVTRKVEVEVEMHAIDGAIQRSAKAVEEAVERIRMTGTGGRWAKLIVDRRQQRRMTIETVMRIENGCFWLD